MNYFAHAIRFLDRPTFAVSTGLPDMLSVLDRKMRLRARNIEPFIDESGSLTAEVAAGALQHLNDDRWFHTTTGFYETTGELSRLFREVLGTADGVRSPFLGHVVAELQLDGHLIERFPKHLDRYYDLVGEVDSDGIEESVNLMATKTSDRLSWLITRFYGEQFMRDYRSPGRLRFRLNQIMLRVGLEPLPDEVEHALAHSWDIVGERFSDLLPAEHFQLSDVTL
jgi:hypothetical protein